LLYINRNNQRLNWPCNSEPPQKSNKSKPNRRLSVSPSLPGTRITFTIVFLFFLSLSLSFAFTIFPFTRAAYYWFSGFFLFVTVRVGPAMSSGVVGTSNSGNVSPRHAAGPTKTRRRVADIIMTDAERTPSSVISDLSDQEDDSDLEGSNCGSSHVHYHHHHHFHHPVIKVLLLRSRAFFCLPDKWLLWAAVMAQSFRSGRNMGRKIFGLLILMAVLSFFVKVSFLSSHVERREKKMDNGLLIVQTVKDDWSMAQRAVAETHTFIPKRVLERLTVCQ
jgi:hypothetical protein